MTAPEETGGVNALRTEVAELKATVTTMSNFLSNLALGNAIDVIDLFVFPDGRAPERKTDGAVGYDCYARSIVYADKMDQDNILRASRANFQRESLDKVDEKLQPFICDDPQDRTDRYAIALPPGERCVVGLGFTTAMPLPMFFYVQPRSGFAIKGINLDNAPGTVDPDYRGEAGALITNRSEEDFVISHGLRVVQGIFHLALLPEFNIVNDYEDLEPSLRGIGGFGSTGGHDV